MKLIEICEAYKPLTFYDFTDEEREAMANEVNDNLLSMGTDGIIDDEIDIVDSYLRLRKGGSDAIAKHILDNRRLSGKEVPKKINKEPVNPDTGSWYRDMLIKRNQK